jgi:hypothetical protein
MESTFFTFSVDWKTLKIPLENSIVTETKEQFDAFSKFVRIIISDDNLLAITDDDFEAVFPHFKKCCFCKIEGTFSECKSAIPQLLKRTFATAKANEQNKSNLFIRITGSESLQMSEVETLTEVLFTLLPKNTFEHTYLIQGLSISPELNVNNYIILEIIFGNIE